jgi:hypothetical protein
MHWVLMLFVGFAFAMVGITSPLPLNGTSLQITHKGNVRPSNNILSINGFDLRSARVLGLKLALAIAASKMSTAIR